MVRIVKSSWEELNIERVERVSAGRLVLTITIAIATVMAVFLWMAAMIQDADRVPTPTPAAPTLNNPFNPGDDLIKV